MAVPVAVATAVVITQTAVQVAEAIFKMANAATASEQFAALGRQIDQLAADMLRLRNEMMELGQTILKAIDALRETVILLTLTEYQSDAETALHHLQAFRDTNDEFHRAQAISMSDNAVTRLKNAQAFGNRTAAIGPFLFVVNVRLQIVTELESVRLTGDAFRSEINEWTGIVRNAANQLENEIRSENPRRLRRDESIVGEELDCQFDIESRRQVCEVVREGHKRRTISYSNISETIDYAFDSDVPGSGQPFRDSSEALERGILDDLQNLGVNNLRRLATTWESTSRSLGVIRLYRRILKRSLTEVEQKVMLEASEKGELDAERIVRGLLQTREFLNQVGMPSPSDNPSTQGTVKAVFTRVVGREPEPDELRINSEMHERFGYNAFVGALSTLVLTLEEEEQGDPTRPPTAEAPTLNTLDVLRSL